MRVVYFGTPAFAVPSLRALVAEGQLEGKPRDKGRVARQAREQEHAGARACYGQADLHGGKRRQQG